MNKIAARLTDTITEFIEQRSKRVDWTHQPVPGKWSPKEILGHLIDSANINLQRFVRCTYENDFTLTYAQNEWVAAQHYRDADITELLCLWRLINKQIITVLNNYPYERWQAICNNNTVEFLANDYIDHMCHHLDQIIALTNGD
ncbi:MAG: DinB superfamily protein [Mucilaginibacter sp.]|nr:DinB superfamily protein [Mucilaginibacter sp.]